MKVLTVNDKLTLKHVAIKELVKVNYQFSQVCGDYKVETSKKTEIQRRTQTETDLDRGFSWLPPYPCLVRKKKKIPLKM